MTVMADGNVARLADSLWQAEIDRSPISPITDDHPGLGLEDAYAIQSYNIERAGGDRSLTDQPDHGRPSGAGPRRRLRDPELQH